MCWRVSLLILIVPTLSLRPATLSSTALDAADRSAARSILLVDFTNFTTLFGGTDSLISFWRNLALMN